MKNSFIILLFFLSAAGASQAGQVKTIDLTDGSVITGEVLSLTNGLYTIRTVSLGTVTVRDDRVRAIRTPGSASSPAAPSSADLSSLTEKMLSDSEIMSMIQSLKNDPSFQKAMEDPDIMKAVSSGDTAALMANPKFLELMNNATVRDIQKKVQK